MSEFSEFEEQSLQIISAQYIMLCRIYDQLALLLPPDRSIELRQMHEQGQTFAPAPYLAQGEEDES